MLDSALHNLEFKIQNSARLKGFTIIEMFTTVAAMFILLGLLVSLARNVRASSADNITRRILRELDVAVNRYIDEKAGNLLNLAPALGVDGIKEDQIPRLAERGTARTISVLREEKLIGSDFLAGLPDWMYDGATLRDAWGSPIAFFPTMHPKIGMAPANRPFFVSAGPDHKFLSRDDNLYSYEQSVSQTVISDTKRLPNTTGQSE